ncbi:hypothetical protein [Thaumasiovibrio subtropicus]|uniref:hypothetical protein n=1 Tax=Thaumasiovibrio subtropicus TaxID=1891207 RepID=UPI00131CEB49|nr:hypothetical protein [Thaumasiovibrio subtropicus]
MFPSEIPSYNWQSEQFDGEPLPLSVEMSFKQQAIQIYRAISLTSKEPPFTLTEDGEFCPIFALAALLKYFGFELEVVLRDESVVDLLNAHYGYELPKLAQLDVPVSMLAQGESAIGEAAFLVSVIMYPLKNGKLTSHYITNNAIGEWMDGQIASSPQKWAPIECWERSQNKRESAFWAGVSIRVFLDKKNAKITS